MSNFRRTFLTGLAALFPILITVFLLSWLYAQLDRTIGLRVNAVCKRVLVQHPGLFETVFLAAGPEDLASAENRREYADDNFPSVVGLSIGIVTALIIIYCIGIAVRSYVGARIVRRIDGFFERFPLIKSIYPHARQVADFMFGSRQRMGFRHVVAVQYPRRGLYTVGFLTGDGLKDVQEHAGQNLVAVFVPTSPAPLTGFVVLAPREEVMDVEMSVEEAIRFCMTAGMVAPRAQRPWEGKQGELVVPPGGLQVVEGGQAEAGGENSEGPAAGAEPAR